MNESIKTALRVIWFIVIIYWTISGYNVKKVKRTENAITNFFFYWLPLIVASLLLGPGEWFGRSWWRENFVPHTNTVGIAGLILCLTGATICCGARYILGKNWSLSVQQKENHQLIKNGIYKIVRHPIYTGLLLLFTGNAIIVGDYRGILAILIVLLSFLFKIKKEEKLMLEIFKDDYENYRQKTNVLIPFIY